MLYCGDINAIFGSGELCAYSLDNDIHEQVLCFIHSLDSDALSRIYAVGLGDSATVYIPAFRDSAEDDETEKFCSALREFLSSLGGVSFGVAPYADFMKEALDGIDCSLIFEAE